MLVKDFRIWKAVILCVLCSLGLGIFAGGDDPLHNPAVANEKAPENFNVVFDTTKGAFTLEIHREWAPIGVDRFYNLVKIGFFEDVAFFRVMGGFMAQFGYHGDPKVIDVWKDAQIEDDPVVKSNKRKYISFATSGPNSRTTNLFINFANNSNLDGMGFAPIGKVIEGMDVVDSLYDGYGEGAPRGMGPGQGKIRTQGNSYLKASFPKLDYIKTAKIVE